MGGEDWWHNAQVAQVKFPPSRNTNAKAHKGFYSYERTLHVKLNRFLFRKVASKLAEWGAVPHRHPFQYLGDWLVSGKVPGDARGHQ